MPVLRALCEYKKVNGCSIKADVYLPRAPYPPVILYIHGGALILGSRKGLLAYELDRYCQAGFAVISMDYRLAPETRLGSIVEDVNDALGWVRGEGARVFNLNAGRIAAVGGSAGGYLSLMTGTFAVKPQAIVSFYGYGDILGDWYCQPSEHYRKQPLVSKEEAYASVGQRETTQTRKRRIAFYLHCRQQGIWPEAVSGYSLATEREKLIPFCPAYNVRRGYPPTLLLHGDQDTDVPYEQSVQMARELHRCGIENELLTLSGRGHGFDSDGQDPVVRRALDTVMSFLTKHLAA